MSKTWFKILILSIVSTFILSSVIQYHHHDCSHEEGSEDYSFCLFHLMGHGDSVCSDESQHEKAESEDDCPLKISNASIIKHTSIEDDVQLDFVFVIFDYFRNLLIERDHEALYVFREVDIILPELFHGNTLRGPPAISLD